MFGALHCFSVFKSIQNYLTRINPCCYGHSVHLFTYATTHAQIHTHNAHTGFTLEEWEMERTILTLYQWRDHTRREKMLFISLKWLSLLDCMMVHATMNLNMVRTKILKQCHLYQIVIFLLWTNIILVF